MKNLEDVFCTIGRPKYTYVKPEEYLRTKIALRTSGKGVIIEGPSGIGKTTCLLATLDELNIDHTEVLSARKKKDCKIIEQLIENSQNAGLTIIDDFHVLSEDLKRKITDLLKTAADEMREDIKLILVGINNAGNHLVHIAPDLNDRIETIKFGIAKDDLIRELINKGEEALNICISNKDDLIHYSMGSFHIAQLLCQSICILDGIENEQNQTHTINVSAATAVQGRMEILSRTFSNDLLHFALGNRGKRKGLQSYFWLLRKIGESNGTINFNQLYIDNPQRKASLQQIVNKGYLYQLIEKDASLKKLFFYDKGSKNLSIDDPKFLFFLRNTNWKEWASQQGFDYENNSTYKYEIALSFSGEIRSIAKRLADKLTEEEITIFYDEEESAYILGKDVEKYLAPIYSSESKFVVPLIDKTYDERVWTKFEKSKYAHRIEQKSVIPIIFTNYVPERNDKFMKIGLIHFNPNGDMESEINKIIQLLKEKLENE